MINTYEVIDSILQDRKFHHVCEIKNITSKDYINEKFLGRIAKS